MFSKGDTFDRPGFDQQVRVKEIQTHKINSKGKREQLPQEIYLMEYVGDQKAYRNRNEFTLYAKDIENLVKF